MNIIDLVVAVFVLLGAYKGWKYGCFRSAISLVGSILIFVGAYYLKNPLSTIFYENLPFRNYGGIFSGITSFNILVYEAKSYFICIAILFAILKVIIKVTGIFERIINFTFALAIPGKFLGIIFGAFEHYIYVFVVLFVLAQIPFTATYLNDSKLGNRMLAETPLLSNITTELYNSAAEVYEICLKYDGKNEEKQAGDYESLDTLMKYNVISPESVKKLKEKGKLTIDNIDELISKYEKKNG